MKKIYIIGLMLLTLVSSVFAGSITDLQYTDNWLWYSTEKDITDSEVTIDADTLGGKNLGQIKNIMTRKDDTVKDEVYSYIESKDSAWSTDKKGPSWSRITEYLFGEFMDYLDSYIDAKIKTAQEPLLDRLDYFEAKDRGVSVDEYQYAMAKKYGSYRSISCDEKMCIKKVQ